MDANQCIRLADSLFSEMQQNSGRWNELRARVMPRAENNANLSETPADASRKGYSSVANRALKTLASAHLTYITPMDQRWFSLKSRTNKSDSKAQIDEWFSRSTEISYMALAESNFYTTIHEVYLDRCLTGTGCMLGEVTKDNNLCFRHIPTGTYGIAEDESGNVDTIVREFKYTAHQAVKAWGLASLPDCIKSAYEDETRRHTERFEFYNLVCPNEHYKFGSDGLDVADRKFKDIYIAKADKVIVHESGLYEFPYMVTRFLKNGESVFGEAPGIYVLEEIKSAILIDRILDTLGSVAAFPRVLLLAEQVREVDLRAGGRTVVSQEAVRAGLPKEWGTGGKYDIGLDRQKSKEDKINAAYYADMLQVISRVDRQMTATEVNAREAEKVMAFSPSFTLFISDFRPMMQRIFALLYRMGAFPDNVPKEIMRYSADGEKFELRLPQVRYLGKIAQAIERIQRYGMEGALATIANFVQVTGDVSIAKRLKPTPILRFLWDSSGAPSECIMTDEESNQLEDEEKKEMQMQMLAQLMQQQAAANKDNAVAQNNSPDAA